MTPTKSPRPVALERVRRRLEHWRRTRPPSPRADSEQHLGRRRGGGAAARSVSNRPGVADSLCRTETASGSDRPRVHGGAPRGFVELRPTNSVADEDCVIEIEGLRTTVRLRLHNVGLCDLAQLSRALAGVDA